MNEQLDDLREKAREAIRTGALPKGAPARTWGGPGIGAVCAVCGAPATRGDLEIEVEFADEHAGADSRSFHMHTHCFAAWESERRALAAEGEVRAPGEQ